MQELTGFKRDLLTIIAGLDDRTNSYTLTDDGRDALRAHRGWEDGYLN
jgi:hypothetical protein